MNCHTIISNTAPGTNHRNHCPTCLWSRHLDLNIPGDRRSNCGARMQPIGLAFKKQRPNRYSTQSNGELMIVHLCLNCGKIASNRIAGDDNSYAILNVFDHSLSLEENTKIKIADLSIRLLL
ncbi:MAG: RNHCP domain-containing protein, partial [Chloroflexi bacterium]|nr:RNHCP domain-containing protein [Chloroflexota bacterium]